jgi:hypothetical protein
MQHRLYQLCLLVALVAPVSGCQGGKAVTRPSHDRHSTIPDQASAVKRLVVQQAATEQAAWGSGRTTFDSDATTLLDGPRVPGLSRVWRVNIGRDHWHPYLVALAGDRLIPLGGFQSPQLHDVARALRGQPPTDSVLNKVGRQLAALADPNGAVQFSFPSDSAAGMPDELNRAWNSHRPDAWPRDTTGSGPDGTMVVVTMLSREARSFTQLWIPYAYSFSFNHDGELAAWSRRQGAGFATPMLPVSSTSFP